jgi:hypothetical protein
MDEGNGKRVKNEERRKYYRKVKNEMKKTQTRPRRNILIAYMTMSWYFKEHDVMM